MAEPHVISALRAKRAYLDGELLEVERQAARLRADLAAIDRALKVFDPNIQLTAIRPVVRRASPKFFKRGELTRAALDTLRRAEKPLTFREIAERLVSEHKLNVTAPHGMRGLVAKVRNSFAKRHDGIKREVVGGFIAVGVE
jgi:hypothetical protein